jgi:hypothetical protein
MPQDNALWTEGKRHRRFSIDVITEDGNNPCNFQLLKRSKKADGSNVPLRHVNPGNDPIGASYPRYVPQVRLSRDVECFQTNAATLHDRSFDIIPRLTVNGWFDDEIIDMSFDMLSRILDLPSHHIALSSVASATDLFNIGHWDAAKKQHPDLLEAYTLPEHAQSFDEHIVTAFIDKDWLVIPINDGYPMGIINIFDSRVIYLTL